MEITLNEIIEALQDAQAPTSFDTTPPSPSDPLDPKPGDTLIIRTVTMNLTGKVVDTSPTWIVLDDAAWIADSGRWSKAIQTGELNEIEPMGDGVRVARAAIVDVTPWRHGLPVNVK
jgi:hypothetical protein